MELTNGVVTCEMSGYSSMVCMCINVLLLLMPVFLAMLSVCMSLYAGVLGSLHVWILCIVGTFSVFRTSCIKQGCLLLAKKTKKKKTYIFQNIQSTHVKRSGPIIEFM